MKTWRVDAGGQTVAIASDGGMPFVIWWGGRLPEDEDLLALARAGEMDLTGGMLDRLPELSLCPMPGDGWQGQPGLVLSRAGVRLEPRFAGCAGGVQASDGGALRLRLQDDALGLSLFFRLAPDDQTGVIAASSWIMADDPVRVEWLAAPVLPGPQLADEVIDLSGRWTREMHLNRVPWAPGIRMRESRTGRSGQEHPPYAIFPGRGCTNTGGEAWGMHYAWSGGHRMVAEELPDGRRQIQWGHATGAYGEGEAARSATLLLTYSDRGLNGLGVAMQRLIHDRVVQWPDPARPRPVHYNCWEAIYFNHNLADLTAIADRAAALGAERFVLDDGWFGRRDDDRSSLGDWVVDRRKWPDGLGPLIAHVQALGMTFGLWVEPEMVNPDSDLYRAHPDWALGPADQVLGRNQMVLDLGRAEVRDYLFARLDAILSEYPIDYLKWDHNRLLPVVDAAQTEGAWAMLDRLRAAHPGVEIESCASGGGRIDAGILACTHRVWLSDCIDAAERLRIQHDAALFLPASVTGSHVGGAHSHTTGRVHDMSFRTHVAAQRHMGFEMDLRRLTEAEAQVLAEVTAWWKANRHWTMAADIHRLDAADPAVVAEMQIARDGGRFILWAGQAGTSVQALPRPLRLTGLDPEARYRLTLRNPKDAPPQSRGPLALKEGSVALSGAALMGRGVQLPVTWPDRIWVVEGERL